MKNTPTFNLKAVMRMTGLSADTLRAWERRYHLPVPERTPGGQRIYSQHDIDILHWLMEKQSEGISISNSVGLWNDLVQRGADPLDTDGSTEIPTEVSSEGIQLSLSRLRTEWLEACLAFNENLADQVINQAFAITTPEIVCSQILMKGLSAIGEGWYRGDITVQQEHFAAGVTQRRLGSLIASSPPASRKETILICCPPAEEHFLANTYLAALLRRQGYKVVDLGANVPMLHLKGTLQKIRPQLVVLSAQHLSSAARLAQATRTLAGIAPLGFGGRIFQIHPELRHRIPAIHLGDTLEGAPAVIHKIIQGQSFGPTEERRNPFEELHELFQLNQQTILSLVFDQYSAMNFSGHLPDNEIHFVNDSVAAALSLGDLDLLLPELKWLDGYLNNHRMDLFSTSNPWHILTMSAHKAIGQEADPLMDWFELHSSRPGSRGEENR